MKKVKMTILAAGLAGVATLFVYAHNATTVVHDYKHVEHDHLQLADGHMEKVDLKNQGKLLVLADGTKIGEDRANLIISGLKELKSKDMKAFKGFVDYTRGGGVLEYDKSVEAAVKILDEADSMLTPQALGCMSLVDGLNEIPDDVAQVTDMVVDCRYNIGELRLAKMGKPKAHIVERFVDGIGDTLSDIGDSINEVNEVEHGHWRYTDFKGQHHPYASDRPFCN